MARARHGQQQHPAVRQRPLSDVLSAADHLQRAQERAEDVEKHPSQHLPLRGHAYRLFRMRLFASGLLLAAVTLAFVVCGHRQEPPFVVPNPNTPRGGAIIRQSASCERPSANNTVLTFKPLTDRMGSRLQMAMGVLALAQYRGWCVCFPPDPMMRWMSGVPRCSRNMAPSLIKDVADVKGPGAYKIGGYDAPVWRFIAKAEREYPGKVWTQELAGTLASMIDVAHPLSSRGELWKAKDSIHVAVHVRRGDIVGSEQYKHAWIPDSVIVKQIEEVLQKLHGQYEGKVIEVHIFSEKDGFDADKYGKVASAYHLVPHDAPLESSLRDWAHFVAADVLIVGGTFSAVPALARSMPLSVHGTFRSGPSTIDLPATIFWAGHGGYFDLTCFVPAWWKPYTYIPPWMEAKKQVRNCDMNA